MPNETPFDVNRHYFVAQRGGLIEMDREDTAPFFLVHQDSMPSLEEARIKAEAWRADLAAQPQCQRYDVLIFEQVEVIPVTEKA